MGKQNPVQTYILQVLQILRISRYLKTQLKLLISKWEKNIEWEQGTYSEADSWFEDS